MVFQAVRRAVPFPMMNAVARRFYGHSLVRSVAMVAGGTAIAQLISVASTPLLTRFYGPEAFGCLSLLIATSSILLPIIGFSYSVAIVVPLSQCDAIKLFELTVGLTVFTSALFCAALALTAAHHPDALAEWIGLTAYESSSFWLLVPLVSASGLALCFQSWLVRAREFRTLATCTAIAAIFGAVAKIGGGVFRPSPWMLAATHAGAGILSALVLGRACFVSISPAIAECQQRGLPANGVLRIGYRYRDFPLYSMPRDMLNGVSAAFPSIMLATLGDIRVAGFYGLARTVLSVPAGLVTQSLSTVLLPHLAASSHAGRPLRPLLIRSMAALLIVGVPIFGTLVLAGPAIFQVAFGRDWVTAGEFTRWLSLWSFATFVDLPCVHAVRFLGLQRPFLLHEIATTAARLTAVYAGLVWANDAQLAVAMLSIVGVAGNGFLVIWVLIVATRMDACPTAALHNAD